PTQAGTLTLPVTPEDDMTHSGRWHAHESMTPDNAAAIQELFPTNEEKAQPVILHNEQEENP
ncbi:MAG: hypothetical protein KGJ21_10585, partial [Pseudomonadota bacterium]|nr:hypothetical protein [Pseudomonadota bacterium]